MQRAASKVDEAAVYHLKVQLHVMKSEIQHAVDTALTCLRGLGIDMPAHPTEEQVQAEYETVWQTLDGRSIESLIDLPLMTDPELQAAMQVLSDLTAPAYFTDYRLFCLLPCRMVKSQPAARDERRFRVRLCHLGIHAWVGALSPLQ